MSEPRVGISQKELKTVAIAGLTTILTFLGFGAAMFTAAASEHGVGNMYTMAALGLVAVGWGLSRMAKL